MQADSRSDSSKCSSEYSRVAPSGVAESETGGGDSSPSLPAARLQLSRFTSHNGDLAKTYSLDPEGTLRKGTAASLVRGEVETLTLQTFNDFGAILASLGRNQALAFGICQHSRARVVTKAAWKAEGGPLDVVHRGREHFAYASGQPGILLLDYDAPKKGAMTGEALLAALYAAVPELKDAAHFWFPSAGSCIYLGDEAVVGVAGQHVYVLVDDAAQIPAIGGIIADRLWLAGHGRYDVSAAGSLLERTLIDGAVFQPERLDFAAGAVCEPPLDQRRGAPVRYGGDATLACAALPRLTREEAQRVEAVKRSARAGMREAAEARRAQWASERAEALQAERPSLSADEAAWIARSAVERGVLAGDFVLYTAEGRKVRVADVLDSPAMWHGARFRDPLEPEYPDERIAYLNTDNGWRPYIWSHAHGGRRYELRRELLSVRLEAGGAARAADRVLAHMTADGGYFERGGVLVSVSDSGEVQPFKVHALKQAIERAIRFERWDMRARRLLPADCPDDLAQRVAASASALPRLAGVVRAPTMTPDGRIIDRPGFDAATRLLFVNDSESEWSTVPERPTEAEALEALGALWAPFALFPFVDATSRGVFLAALLTAAVRRALPTAPAFMLTAPAAGSGKTLLGACLAELAGGGSAITLPDNDTETAKVIISALRRGSPVLFFDNVTRAVDSPSLNAMLTTSEMEGRILGASDMTGALPTNVLTVITGNNARPAGDACRRVLVAGIDARSEAPYLRNFDFNPLHAVRTRRLALVASALTILRGWRTSGQACLATGSLGSFEAWEGLIRQAVCWVAALDAKRGSAAIGIADPIGRVEEQYSLDEETEALRALLVALEGEQDGAGIASTELYRTLEASRRGGGAPAAGSIGAALLGAMPGVQSAKGVGYRLRAWQGRIVGGRRLESRRDPATNSTAWLVRRG